jgi:DNA-binding IclR family transcriptional regulator
VVDGWQTVRMHGHVNKRSPASCTSLGKALLSGFPDERVREIFDGRELPAMTPASITTLPDLLHELAQVRVLGYACDNEELEPGLRCVAAPIRDAGGTVVASLGVSGPAARFTPEVLAGLSAGVRQAADEATIAIGGTVSRE